MFLIRFILLFLFISVILRVIGRVFYSFRGDQSDRQRSDYFKKKKSEEGRVTVMNSGQSGKKKIIPENEGEYVRYEEMDK